MFSALSTDHQCTIFGFVQVRAGMEVFKSLLKFAIKEQAQKLELSYQNIPCIYRDGQSYPIDDEEGQGIDLAELNAFLFPEHHQDIQAGKFAKGSLAIVNFGQLPIISFPLHQQVWIYFPTTPAGQVQRDWQQVRADQLDLDAPSFQKDEPTDVHVPPPMTPLEPSSDDEPVFTVPAMEESNTHEEVASTNMPEDIYTVAPDPEFSSVAIPLAPPHDQEDDLFQLAPYIPPDPENETIAIVLLSEDQQLSEVADEDLAPLPVDRAPSYEEPDQVFSLASFEHSGIGLSSPRLSTVDPEPIAARSIEPDSQQIPESEPFDFEASLPHQPQSSLSLLTAGLSEAVDELLHQLADVVGGCLILASDQPLAVQLAGETITHETQAFRMQEIMSWLEGVSWLDGALEKLISGQMRKLARIHDRTYRIDLLSTPLRLSCHIRPLPHADVQLDDYGLSDFLATTFQRRMGVLVLTGPQDFSKTAVLRALMTERGRHVPGHALVIGQDLAQLLSESTHESGLCSWSDMSYLTDAGQRTGVDNSDCLIRSLTDLEAEVVVLEALPVGGLAVCVALAQAGKFVIAAAAQPSAGYGLRLLEQIYAQNLPDYGSKPQLRFAALQQRLLRSLHDGCQFVFEAAISEPNGIHYFKHFDDQLISLVVKGVISLDQAVAVAYDPEALKVTAADKRREA